MDERVGGEAAVERRSPILLGLLALCLAAQLYLVFAKSFNWDEFLHFRQVYELRAGTLYQPFQVFHLRLFTVLPDLFDTLVGQMRAARLVMFAANLFTLAMIVRLARLFVGADAALVAAIAYLGAGYVFTHGFSIRADPLVTAVLMGALALLSRGTLSPGRLAAVGALVGLAGMMTFKAAFYAPAFAGLLWWRTQDRRAFALKGAIIGGSAAAGFVILYLLHSWNFAAASGPLRRAGSLGFFLRWLSEGTPFQAYTVQQALYGWPLTLAILATPLARRHAGLDKAAQVALLGFLAPLLVLFFYRNTFPYFFVFLLAPVAVAVSPAWSLARERYGSPLLAALLAVMPAVMTVNEPRDVLERQQALIDFVHRDFPRPVGYLDYSGMIADYPRVIGYLTSGNGMRLYRENNEPILAREMARDNLPFIIANDHAITAALLDRPMPGTFLPQDVAAIAGNYVRQWGLLWREGEAVPAGGRPFTFTVPRDGSYVLSGGPLSVDGKALRHGDALFLAAGEHRAEGRRAAPAVLWRGKRLPGRPPQVADGEVYSRF